MPEQKTKIPKRRCDHCGKTYQPKSRRSRFDNAACRLAKWIEDHPRIGVGA